jgi:hypothetical protein
LSNSALGLQSLAARLVACGALLIEEHWDEAQDQRYRNDAEVPDQPHKPSSDES